MAITVALVCGVAMAATITCPGTASCFGTDDADIMTGTSADNNMFGEGGADMVKGRGGADFIRGDEGEDALRGGAAADTLWGGSFDAGGNYNDASNDYVRGGSGDDSIIGGFAVGGVDHIFAGQGNDSVNTAQRGARTGVPVTKEIVNCGPGGSDTVYFDRRRDVIRGCEIRRQGTAASALKALTVIGARGRGRWATLLWPPWCGSRSHASKYNTSQNCKEIFRFVPMIWRSSINF